ncbi:IclR family transcriptional regulator [Pseudonocardia sp. KRD291]|uniref:IclR family transcriptional regulator n=1 Tax=Pseudonocardia sp. KRD291 TaxID=2792007 RepID=UPI001C4A138A|nr:IclR family transcriptional regulator [Pseudonocardia sp. KRD291]MBW0102399.1 IclR family transcriptional regulator [Pseudonocardia sp. KRD291]
MDGQRLTRIFDVIDQLAEHGPQTVTELSSRLNLPLSSTHDLVKAMVEARALACSGRSYGLGPRAVRAALNVMDAVALPRVAGHHLDLLVQKIGFDVYLAMATGTRVVYVARHAGRQRVNLDIPLGRSLLLHSTAVGKLFAAHRPDVYRAMFSRERPALTPQTRTTQVQLDRDLAGIRSRGVSISRGESLRGVVGLATPVRAPDGSLIAAVHVSALRNSLPSKEMAAVVAAMHETSTAIETEIADPAVA